MIDCELCALEEASGQTFQKRDDDKVYALNPWPSHVHVSAELVEQADRRALIVGEGVLEFRVANGWAIYRVTRQPDPDYPLWDGEEWESEWQPA